MIGQVLFSRLENAIIAIKSRGAGVRSVRAMNLSAGATVLAAAIAGVGIAPAHADINNPAINGTFLATWNGEWAKSQDTYHDEPSIQSVWTISTTCENPVACSGTVTSDQGWTANIIHKPGLWKVIRELPNWETCGDGTAATGRQVITFWPITSDPVQPVNADSTTLSGEDETTGPSGACGINNELQINMPFKLVKIG